MRLGVRIVLYLGAASLVPLGLLGLGATRLGADRVLEKVAELQGAHADALGGQVETWVALQLRLLGQQATAIPVGGLSPEERAQWRRLVYLQSPELGLVAELDREGRLLGAPARIESPEAQVGAMSRRAVVDEARLSEVLAALPLDELERARSAAPDGTVPAPALGSPLRPTPGGAPVLPVLVTIPDAGYLGVELSLATLERMIASRTDPDHALVILDGEGRVLLGDGRGWVDPGPLQPLLRGAAATSIRYQTGDGTDVLAACSPVRGLGWTVIVAEPVASSLTAVREIRAQTAYIALVAALLSVVVGMLFARQLSRPVGDLRDAALAVAEGDVRRRVAVEGSDEVTELARAFNFMSERLEANADRIAAQSAEIEAFNAELQERVEARTRELSAAQDQLLRSARLAAVGEMGAGLAHELNNPVAGILGLAQVLQRRPLAGAEAAMVGSIEAQARRCKDIVSSLLGFSREGDSEAELSRGPTALLALVTDVMALVKPGLDQRGLSVSVEVAPGLHCGGDRAVLGRALAQILMGMRAAAPSGGAITVRSGLPAPGGDGPVLELELRADRFAVGSDDWMAAGMGRWAARRALSELGGHVEEPGDGADSGEALLWRVVLPGVKSTA